MNQAGYYQTPSDYPPRTSPSKLTTYLLLFLTVAVGFLLAERAARRRIVASQVVREVTPRGDLGENEKSTIELFQNSTASVVHIRTVVASRHPFSTDISLWPRGTGSGFVWDENGHIVTNFHVIEGATNFAVTFANQQTYEATFVGKAPHKDLAVLKVDLPKEVLHPIAVGESDDLQVGQSVFAIGNPFGLDQTLTTGVISGLGREIRSTTERPISDVVQTDAAINPGNSGGPLLDSAGRLIGVNTSIVSSSGASDGVGFAIPVDTVRRVVPQLILHQRVVTPSLQIMGLKPAIAERFGVNEGVIVAKVLPGGAADDGGVLPLRYDRRSRIVLGDLIVGVNDTQIRSMDDLYRVLEQHSIGDTVKLHVIRSPRQTRLSLDVILGRSEG